jgi:hypothetical protein
VGVEIVHKDAKSGCRHPPGQGAAQKADAYEADW